MTEIPQSEKPEVYDDESLLTARSLLGVMYRDRNLAFAGRRPGDLGFIQSGPKAADWSSAGDISQPRINVAVTDTTPQEFSFDGSGPALVLRSDQINDSLPCTGKVEPPGDSLALNMCGVPERDVLTYMQYRIAESRRKGLL